MLDLRVRCRVRDAPRPLMSQRDVMMMAQSGFAFMRAVP